MTLSFYKVSSLPDKDFDRIVLTEAAAGSPLAIIYDLEKGFTAFGINTNKESSIDFLMKAIPGLEFSKIEGYGKEPVEFELMSVFRKKEALSQSLLEDSFRLGENRGFLGIVFLPVSGRELHESKRSIEKSLEKMGVKETASFTNASLAGRASNSIQKDIVSNSEERLLLGEVLESINNAVLNGAATYKIGIISSKLDKLSEFARSKFLLLGKVECRIRLQDLDKLGIKAFPVGPDKAADLIRFYKAGKLNYLVNTEEPDSRGDIPVGTFMEEGVHDTGYKVSIDGSLLNLGMIITGLPGSGKTFETMQIINAVAKNRTKRVIVIAPTDEWNEFARNTGMHLIRIYEDRVPLNFFRCAEGVERPVFYEDLAMLLSSASDAGPYRNPMEKCMLNAFKRVYDKESNPDPVEAYEEIEESIIRLHGKKTNVGIKYTKHGENIKSALENLRSILRRPEYSSRQGVKFEELIEQGVVFDLSKVSNKFKPYLYALLLNQAYMLANLLDTRGDNELRLLICLEEAQVVLGQRQGNAAAEDLKYRIQDFRKKGVGLVLLAHSVDDIDRNIRRLCQIKLYLKQAPDVAEIAAEDLVFTRAERDQVIAKLKHLDSRVGALNYMVREGNEKIAKDTVFIRTLDFEEKLIEGNTLHSKTIENFGLMPEASKTIEALISISRRKGKAENTGLGETKIERELKLRISYLCETIAEHRIMLGERFEIMEEMTEGRPYKIELIDEKKKTVYSNRLLAQNRINIEI
ncbi:MAG: hypothetical protein ACP5NE_01750 [Candidatus Micrarchaeia archaeon]